MPSPQPSPTGEGADCSRFNGCRRFERQLRFAAVDCRSSEKQKAACTICFPCKTLNHSRRPSSLPWKRARERATSRKACIGRLVCWERLPRFGRMPSPQPSSTGEGAGCSRFCGFRQFKKQIGFAAVDCRSSEK